MLLSFRKTRDLINGEFQTIIIALINDNNWVLSKVSFFHLCLPVLSAGNLCKRFGPISGPTKCRA